MNFNTHSALAGKHATLSASKYHWVNYDDVKLLNWFKSQLAAKEGTEMHNIAAALIQKGIKLPRNSKTLNQYVNEAIGFRMTAEQVLFYSFNCFGTADAISYRREADGRMVLRVHDLKTGISPASMKQLMIYVAMFCLEYDLRPFEIDLIELRIYQMDKVEVFVPPNEDIVYIMDRIVSADRLLTGTIEESVA